MPASNVTEAPPRSLVLASSSPYRKALLQRLGLPFSIRVPDVDESPVPGEDPSDLALRLARTKAEAVLAHCPKALIIGSDQVAVCGGRVLGKPGHIAAACEQLMALSGRSVRFLTGLALLNSETRHMQVACISFEVHFRILHEEQIRRYLTSEQPFGCTGSFKSEGLGIALVKKMEGEDPTALIGLPLIQLVGMLRSEGIDVLAPEGG
ncbi:MAG: Maf family protein [Gammaproteobacteria bacterium]